MASNSKDLIEALDISDADSDCVSIEEDEVGSEISEVSVPSTSTCANSVSAAPSLLEVLKVPKLSEISRKRKMYANKFGTRSGKRRKTRGSSSSASEPKTSNHSSD